MSESLKDFWKTRQPATRASAPRPSRREPAEEPPTPQHEPLKEDAREQAWGASLTVVVSVMLIALFAAWLPFTRSPDYFAQLPLLLFFGAVLGIIVLRRRAVSAVSWTVWAGVLALTALALLSAFLSDRPTYGLFGDGNGFPVASLVGALILIPFLLALRPEKNDIENVLMVIGAILLGYSLLASRTDSSWLPRVMSDGSLGTVLLALLPLAWRKAMRGEERRGFLRVIGTFVIFAGLLHLGRQDYLAIAALEFTVMTFLAARGASRHWGVLRFGAVFAALALLFAFRSFPRVAELSLTHATTWSVTSQAVRSHPLLGFGPSAFDEVYTRFRPLTQTSESFWTIIPREGSSFVLTLLATYGTAFTVLLYACLFGILWKSIRRGQQDNALALSLGALIAVSFLTSFSRIGFVLLCIFCVLVLQRRERSSTRLARTSLAVASLFIVLTLYSGFVMTRYAIADFLFERAYAKISEASDPDAVRGDLQRVRSWYAWDAEYDLTAAQHNAVMISLDKSKSDKLTSEAIQEIHHAMTVNPNSKSISDAFLVLRDLETVSGKDLSSETEGLLDDLTRRDERNPLTHLFVGQHFIAKATRPEQNEEARKAALVRAKKAFARIEELSPNTLSATFGNIQIALAEKRYDEAEAKINELMTTHPREPELPLLLARMYRERGAAAGTDEERNGFREKEKGALTSVLQSDSANVEAKNRLAELGQ